MCIRDRVNDEITKELANIIRGELKDPRIGVMTSVLRVDTTQDLKYCKVYISVLGNDDEKNNVMKGLKSASGYIRHLLAERINLRVTPELIFKLDDSVAVSYTHLDVYKRQTMNIESLTQKTERLMFLSI